MATEHPFERVWTTCPACGMTLKTDSRGDLLQDHECYGLGIDPIEAVSLSEALAELGKAEDERVRLAEQLVDAEARAEKAEREADRLAAMMHSHEACCKRSEALANRGDALAEAVEAFLHPPLSSPEWQLYGDGKALRAALTTYRKEERK